MMLHTKLALDMAQALLPGFLACCVGVFDHMVTANAVTTGTLHQLYNAY